MEWKRLDARDYLVSGEEILHWYGKHIGFICITNKRVLFVDDYENKVVSIPFDKIEEVKHDYDFTTGKFEIITKRNDYLLKLGDSIAYEFIKHLFELMMM